MSKFIFVDKVKKTGPNGDRDFSGGKTYYNYHIHILDEGSDASEATKGTRVHKIDGYDHHWTHPHDLNETEQTARDYAQTLSERTGFPVRWGDERLKPFVVRTEPYRIYAESIEQATEIFKAKAKAGQLGDSIGLLASAE